VNGSEEPLRQHGVSSTGINAAPQAGILEVVVKSENIMFTQDSKFPESVEHFILGSKG